MNSSTGNTQEMSNTRKNVDQSQSNPIDELLTVRDVANLIRVPISSEHETKFPPAQAAMF